MDQKIVDYIVDIVRATRDPQAIGLPGVKPLVAYGGSPRASIYLAQAARKGLAASSRARKLSAIRQFFAFLFAEGIRGDDPSSSVESPKQSRPLPKLLSVDEIDTLLRVAAERAEVSDGGKRLRAARLHCLLEVLYATGLRVSELVSLPRSAVTSGDSFITVTGKGGRERIVPLTNAAREAIATYLALAEDSTGQRPWLFPSRGAKGHLTRQRFSQELKEAR